MKLLVDIGNSRIKYCYSKLGELSEHKAIDYTDQGFEQALEQQQPPVTSTLKRIIVCSVAGEHINNRFRKWCQQFYKIAPDYAVVSRQFHDLEHAYTDLQEFGIDRWMAMIAARNIKQCDCLVVDCGTATTIDAITANGKHLGGMITPGANLMLESLFNNTQEIHKNAANDYDSNSLFGQSTRECLQKGARQSVIALIETVYHQYQQQCSVDPVCFITGGAADAIIEHMTIEFNHLPHLVLQGLDIWSQDQ